MNVLNQSSLDEAKRDLLSRSGGIVAFPVTGLLFWFALSICGFMLTPDAWRLVAFIGSGLLVPTALLIAKLFKTNLYVPGHPLAALGGLPMASVTLPLFPVYVVLDGPAIHVLPLAFAIGMGLHFPLVGWMYGSRVCTFHIWIRAVLAFAVWAIWPEGRFTILPLVVAVVYLVTAVLVRAEVLRARAA